ncbi:MAG TPA: hypothetical protein VN110_03150 [Sphingobium sp.]|nr:hypothetical protein [Sphingobium sp.]
MLRLTPGTSMTFIGDQPLIVSQSRHAVYELNQIAGYIGCRLEDGISASQLAREVADRGISHPSAMLQKVLADWSQSGLVHAAVWPPASPPILVQNIALGARGFGLRYHDDALVRHIAPLFAHLTTGPAAEQSSTTFDLWQNEGFCLFSRDGGPAALLQLNQAATLVKAQLVQDIIDDPRWTLALHAGCVSRNGKALLLSGPPGAGKTTLISWLIGSGFAYHGDDISMVEPDGRVLGLPFLPTVKSGAWPMMAGRYPGRLQALIHWRPDGRRVRYLDLPQSPGEEPLPVRWIVKLKRTKGARAQLIPHHPAALVKHLLSEAASSSGEADRAAIDIMIRTVGSARTCVLEYDDLDEAAALLGEFCAPA